MARKAKNGSGKPRGKRRSKGEDSTGAKENTAEMRTPSLDLQQIVIDDGDFDLHFRGVKAAKVKAEQYQSAYRSSLKAAKKVSSELCDSIKLALKFETMDAADIKAELEIRGYVLKRQGSPVQLTIHDTLMGDVNQAADTSGYRDAKAGRVAKSPYPESSDLHELYMAGWQRGTRENMGLPPEDGDETEDAVKGNGLGHNSSGVHEATI